VSARRRRSSRSAAVVLAVVAGVLAGCATAIAPPRQPIAADARRALDLLAARWQTFDDLRTLADVTVKRGGDARRLMGILLVKAPASVRFEALSPFGQPFLFVTLHEGRLMSYDATSNELLMGPATADTTARLLGLPFDPDDLVGVLAGLAPPLSDVRDAAMLPPDELGPSVEMHGLTHRKRVWLDLETGIVRQQEIIGGRYEARVTYERDAEGGLKGFILSAVQGNVTGVVTYRNPVVDAGIDGERFTFVAPKGAKIQTIR
jgi:outer membrane lipoprotein-sorting protein